MFVRSFDSVDDQEAPTMKTLPPPARVLLTVYHRWGRIEVILTLACDVGNGLMQDLWRNAHTQ
jgi:hypothetical protein